MKISKKRIINLGLLTTTFLTPLSFVACVNPHTLTNDEDAKVIALLKSSDFQAKLENYWIDKAIKNVQSNIKFNDGVFQNSADFDQVKLNVSKFIIHDSLRKNNKYLVNLVQKLPDPNDKTTHLDFSKYLEFDNSGSWTISATLQKEFIQNYLLNEDYNKRTHFLTNVYKIIITKYYLGISYKEWSSVFLEDSKNKLTSVENIIAKDSHFPLTKFAVNNHYALSWEIKLDKTKSNKHLLDGKKLFSQMMLQMNPTTNDSIAQDASLNTRIKKATNGFVGVKTLDQGFENAVGFASSLLKLPENKDSGSVLDFSISGWRKKTNFQNLKGFLQNNDIIGVNNDTTTIDGQKVPKISNGTKATKDTLVDIKTVWALLPSYDSSKKSLNFDLNVYNLDDLSNLFILTQQDNLFTDAIKYFHGRKDSITIVIPLEKYWKLLKEIGNKYISNKHGWK